MGWERVFTLSSLFIHHIIIRIIAICALSKPCFFISTGNAEDRNRNINSSNTINNNSIENLLTGTTTTASPIKNNSHHNNNNISSHHNHHLYNHQQNHHNNLQIRANSRNSSSSNNYGRGNSDIVRRPIKWVQLPVRSVFSARWTPAYWPLPRGSDSFQQSIAHTPSFNCLAG